MMWNSEKWITGTRPMAHTAMGMAITRKNKPKKVIGNDYSAGHEIIENQVASLFNSYRHGAIHGFVRT